MKSIVFTIKTAYSREKYFMELKDGQDVEDQIDTALLRDMCFCDEYKLVRYKEADEKHHIVDQKT